MLLVISDKSKKVNAIIQGSNLREWKQPVKAFMNLEVIYLINDLTDAVDQFNTYHIIEGRIK